MTEKEVIRVCFCTPDPDFGGVVGRALGAGYTCDLGNGSNSDAQLGKKGGCDCVLLDLRTLPNGAEFESGREQIERFQQTDFPPPIIIMLADNDAGLARRFVEAGVCDVLTGPPDIAELRQLLRRAHRLHQMELELRRLRDRQETGVQLKDLFGFGDNMDEVFKLARKVAPCDVNVLITGETGTGKTMLGRALHALSLRRKGPLISFSCSNLPESLVDDELFGHEKGAFTGALTLRRGRFEVADGGTLFLDEIGDLPLGLQSKLLRVLQERTFERLGSNTPISVNVRLLCATHRNLEQLVQRGEFRADLYYRLNVIQLHMPPLRNRGGKVVLAQHLLQRVSTEFGKRVIRFSRQAIEAIDEYYWPGNVRELENVIRRAVVLAEGTSVEIWHLPPNLSAGFEPSHAARSYEDELRDFKRRLVVRTLQGCHGNKAEAARTLGLARGYLHRLIKDLKIQTEETSLADGAEDLELPNIVM